jgi:beta-barrel assembly-enhancing protease
VRWRSAFLLASSLLCASCGPISKLPSLASEEVEAERHKQQVDHIRDYFTQRGRLHNVAFRIRAANQRDCKDRSAQIGLEAGTVPSLPRKFRSYSHEALSLSWTHATVLSVAETSPAAAGGIKPGDHVLTFNNEPVPGSETADWIRRFVRENGERPIRVLVRRDGVDESRTVTPVLACTIPIELITDSSLNAFTTGDRIVVHSSILRVAHTDAQLALVVGHELAHANLGHMDKRLANQIIGWAGGATIDAGLVLGGVWTGGVFAQQFARAGASAFSVNFEREADYVGAYYAARAGYDVAGAEEIWRAFSLENPDDIRVGRTHPITPVRFVQMQKAAAEITDKQRRSAPLVPELSALQAEVNPTGDSE